MCPLPNELDEAKNNIISCCYFSFSATGPIGWALGSRSLMRTLLTEVENHRTNLMVVLAGYKARVRLKS